MIEEDEKIHIVDKIMETGLNNKFSKLADEFNLLQKERKKKENRGEEAEKIGLWEKFIQYRREDNFRSFSPHSIRMPRKDLLDFSKSLSIMLDSGINLVEALVLLRNQARTDRNYYILHKIVEIVREGEPLSVAMKMFKKTFSNLFVSSIECGEESGKLDKSLSQMHFYMERESRMRSQITQAMIYPGIIISIAVIINSLLLIFVVPKFKETFTSILGAGATLPVPTQILISIGDFYLDNLLIILSCTGGFIFLFAVLNEVKLTKFFIDKLIFRIPILGKLLLKDAIAKLSLTLAILLSSGIPIIRAFTILSTSSNNSSIAKLMRIIKKNISDGENIANTFDFTNAFPPVMITMIDVGEQTGRLNEMFDKIGNLYNTEVDDAIEALESTLEPILTIGIALPIAFVVIALFLPLVDIIQNLTG